MSSLLFEEFVLCFLRKRGHTQRMGQVLVYNYLANLKRGARCHAWEASGADSNREASQAFGAIGITTCTAGGSAAQLRRLHAAC